MVFKKGHPKYGNGGFKKGHIPWTKGKKGIHFSPETEFKKGHISWNKGKDSRIEMICEECGKKFKVYPCDLKRKYCSKKCYGKSKAGKPSSMKGKHHTKEALEKISEASKKIIRTKKWGENISKAKLKHPTALFGEDNPNWREGKSFEPYDYEFNKKLKKQIRKRDNFTCQECKMTEKQLKKTLLIHHIDYNKKNNNPKNLISLCRSCHTQTNFSRNDWINYFQNKISEIYA